MGSTISRVTYVTRRLSTHSPAVLCKLYCASFYAYTSLTAAEATIMAVLIHRDAAWFSVATKTVMWVLQILFTTTKVRTSRRIFTVYSNEMKLLQSNGLAIKPGHRVGSIALK